MTAVAATMARNDVTKDDHHQKCREHCRAEDQKRPRAHLEAMGFEK